MHALARRAIARTLTFSTRTLALVAVGLVALALVPGIAGAANTGFVEVEDGQFVLDGERFDFVGTVAFALLAGKIYGIESFTHDVVASARTNNFRVVRIWGYFNGRPESIQPAPRQYNESALRALDWVIKQFDDAGVRLIVPFIGRYEDFGGMLTYAQWVGRGPNLTAFYTDPAAKALYKDYVRMLLNRTNTFTGRKYKDEPTILAWELADEPNLPDVDRSGNIFHAWASEMAAFVKSLDGNHLLGTGEEGYDTSPQGYSDVASTYNGNFWLLDGNKGVSYTRNTAIPHIDYGTFKFYPEYWLMPNKAASGAAWVRDHVRIARALGKPAVFSEFGDGASGQADDPAVFEAWLAALDQEGGGGAQFWQLVAPGWWCDQFCVIHPPASRVADALRAAATRANSRSRDGVPAPPPLEFTAAATASPDPVQQGQTVTLASSVTASAAATGIVVDVGDLEPGRHARRPPGVLRPGLRRRSEPELLLGVGRPGQPADRSPHRLDRRPRRGRDDHLRVDPAADTVRVEAPPPSFSVGSTSATPSPVTLGQTATVATSVTGGAAASGIVVDVGIWNQAGTRVAQQAYSGQSFAAGQSRGYAWPWVVPGGLTAGTYRVSVGVLDATRSTTYASVASASTLSVQPPAAPSFTVGSTSATPSPVAPGQTATVATGVTGGVAASGIIVDVGIWNQAGTRVAQQAYSGQSFAAGQSRGYTWPWVVPAGLTAGTYRVSVGVLDATRSTTYASVASASTLSVQPPAAPSFTVGSTSATPSPVAPGQTATVATGVTGGVAASGIIVDVGIWNQAGTRVAQQAYSGQSFAAGQSRGYTWPWVVPAGLAAGTYRVSVGVFGSTWTTPYRWIDQAATFSVQAPATLAFSVGPTTASPNPVSRGQSVTIGTAVRATAPASGIIVDLEIYDPQGRRVAQRIFSGQSFAAGQTRGFTWTWPVGATQSMGTYTVKVGIFSGNWSTLYRWEKAAGAFRVQ